MEKRFKIITEAYHFLKKQSKHTAYDKNQINLKKSQTIHRLAKNSTRGQNGEKMENRKRQKLIGDDTQKILRQMKNGGKDMKMNFGKNMKKQ